MKVALSVWDGHISPVFDVAREMLILSVEGQTVLARQQRLMDDGNPLQKNKELAELGVQTLICGAISKPLLWDLSARGIQVFNFVAGDIETVITAFVAGQLPNPKLVMPGCRVRQPNCRAVRAQNRARRRGRRKSDG